MITRQHIYAHHFFIDLLLILFFFFLFSFFFTILPVPKGSPFRLISDRWRCGRHPPPPLAGREPIERATSNQFQAADFGYRVPRAAWELPTPSIGRNWSEWWPSDTATQQSSVKRNIYFLPSFLYDYSYLFIFFCRFHFLFSLSFLIVCFAWKKKKEGKKKMVREPIIQQRIKQGKYEKESQSWSNYLQVHLISCCCCCCWGHWIRSPP